MASNDTRLRVAIVGSGIAGLAAARILREKHDVTVYERGEPSVATGGQGIANFPNSTHILESMGFDYKRVGSVELGGWNSVDKHGKYLHSIDYNMRERYGAPLVSHMRVDFRTELLRLATAPAGDLGLDASATPAITMWNNGAVDLDPEAGLVTLEDGSVVEADVVIGLICCRVAVSAERVEQAIGKLPQWWQDQREKGQGHMRITQKERKNTTESWHADGDRDEILEIYDDFEDSLKTMSRVADQVKLWELQDLEPLPTWTSGRAILIGDAAHAMTPMQGQDADGLRLLTQPGVARDGVPEVLKAVESVRRPRATRVLMNTRSTSKISSAADRYAKFDENCTYTGILGALKQQAAAA
ncbi:FAD binding domain protein [Xylaria digitata]|nr:FAD binding domain protein [Xylaria digitata]